MYQVLGHYINGWWIDCLMHAEVIDNINPSTEEVLGRFPKATQVNVADAVAAARKAQKKWRQVSRVERAERFYKVADLLMKHHDKIMHAISLETGKNLNEAHAEILEAQHMALYVAGTGRLPFGEVVASEIAAKESIVIRKPKGVVAVISPWNFPLAIGFWCSIPSIVEGNCVVQKPSELTPLTAQYAAEIYDEAGFPAGVFNLIQGDGETGAELVKADVDVILFTGSAEVGQQIRRHCAGTWHKTCSCEMGSKSAVMVFGDGDFDLALDACIASSFKLSGQRCVSAGRILIERSIYGKFCDVFVERVKQQVVVGDPFDTPAPYCGPLISHEHTERVLKFNEMVVADNDAKILIPGCRMDKGFNFVSPFVYQCEWSDKPFLKQEVFGPNVSLIPFNDTDDAIRIYNDTDYGLSLGVISDDFRKHRQLRNECRAGMLYLNGGSIAAESHLPFGGVGKSGNGWKSAAGTYKAVTDEMVVTTNFENKIQWAQGMRS